MPRLVLVDHVGGSLSALGAAMARLEGAPGFDEVVARTSGEVKVAPVVSEVLQEVGIHLVPMVKQLGEPAEGDVVVELGDATQLADAVWSFRLADAAQPPLVQRSTARTTRDRLARAIAAVSHG